MIRLADYVAQFLISHNVKDIFMLTGYGAMYMNDAIEVSGIKHYATRNEATAPMMAEAYARVKGALGVVCVTAGPGATNAVPGLAEAWVDSAPVLILSGQVVKKHTTHCSGVSGLRTFGTAEIDIIPIVKPITKFAAIVDEPDKIRFLLEKALHMATSGRPGPVWLDIPLDVQNSMIDPLVLDSYVPEPEFNSFNLEPVWNLLEKSKCPLLVCGQGIRQAGAIAELEEFVNKMKIPILFSRLGQDILPHSHPYVFGHGGIKGVRYCKDIMGKADVVVSLGCRLAVQFVGHEFEAFANARVIAIDIDEAELLKPGVKLDIPLQGDVRVFLQRMIQEIPSHSLPEWSEWVDQCKDVQNKYPFHISEQNPIDLYKFMDRLGKISGQNNILVTDAGSNYYIGGQVWKFENGQREITSGANAAMGTTIPLAIGSAIADPKAQVLAVTGDGSLELNIQELKTISHYGLNLKLFVINNGGYVSMKKWQDTFFEGRRIDTEESTGLGTLDLKKIAEAFDLEYARIDDVSQIDNNLHCIMAKEGPLFVEVVTTKQQRIVEAFQDH